MAQPKKRTLSELQTEKVQIELEIAQKQKRLDELLDDIRCAPEVMRDWLYGMVPKYVADDLVHTGRLTRLDTKTDYATAVDSVAAGTATIAKDEWTCVVVLDNITKEYVMHRWTGQPWERDSDDLRVVDDNEWFEKSRADLWKRALDMCNNDTSDAIATLVASRFIYTD